MIVNAIYENLGCYYKSMMPWSLLAIIKSELLFKSKSAEVIKLFFELVVDFELIFLADIKNIC